MSTLVRVMVRGGTAAAWAAANPVLLLDELGYEEDTRKLKFGDGVTAWNSLPYFSTGTSYTDEQAQDAVGNILVDSATIDFTYDDAGNSIAAIVKDGSIGLAKQAALAANSFVGNNTGAAATPIALTVAQAKILLAIAATDVSGLATVATSGAFADTTGTVGVTRGGLGLTGFAQGDIVYASATNTLAALAKSSTAQRVLTNGGTSNSPSWAQVSLTAGVTGTLPVGNGGTGTTTSTGSGSVVLSASPALTGTMTAQAISVTPTSTPATAAGVTQFVAGESSNNAGYKIKLGFFNDGGFGGSLDTTIASVGGRLIINGSGGAITLGGPVTFGSGDIATSSGGKVKSVVSTGSQEIYIQQSGSNGIVATEVGCLTMDFKTLYSSGIFRFYPVGGTTEMAEINAQGIVSFGSLRSASYTVATVPSASTHGAGAIIYVSNESGGATTAFSDGTNWRRHADRAIIS